MIKHFKHDEFSCPCCGQNNIDGNLVKILDTARDIARVPFVINSGYRCAKHNAEVGGKPSSSHLSGTAVDVKCLYSSRRFTIINALLEAGFTRIGIAESYIHCDIDGTKSPEVIWTYC